MTKVDLIVSIAKFKTHCMMLYTGGVKFIWCHSRIDEGEISLRTSTENFADHLIDICEYVRPDFSLIDAIEGMEGNGLFRHKTACWVAAGS